MSASARALLLRQLLEINRSGRFGQPIQFSHIRDEAEVAGLERAVKALQQLQQEAAEVSDPVDYLRRAIFAPALIQGEEEDQGENGHAHYSGGEACQGGEDDDDGDVDVAGGGGMHGDQEEENEEDEEAAAATAFAATGGLSQVPTMRRKVVAKREWAASSANAPATKRLRSLAVKQEAQAEEAEEQAGTDDQHFSQQQQHYLDEEQQDPAKVKTQDGEEKGDFTESQLLERYMAFLNEKKCKVHLDPAETLPVLDCVGYKHAMKVLQTFEASSASLEKPLDFIKDLVARSSWIWVTPGMLPEDDKVARRIAWLNLFGNLKRPISYSEIANSIDSLRVPHAMVLLRELEAQAEEVEDPTEYLKKAVAIAGGGSEEDGCGAGGAGHMMASPVVPPVSVAQMVAGLNSSGRLYKKLDPVEVSHLAAGLAEETVSSLLEDLINKGSRIKDPFGFLKFKLKALHAAKSSGSQ